MFLGSKVRPVRRTDKLATICKLSRQCGIREISHLYKLPWPVTWIGFTMESECPVSCRQEHGDHFNILLSVSWFPVTSVFVAKTLYA
jgi:hypothetical protein